MAEIFLEEYAPWLEAVVRDLVEICPSCIALEMRDSDGKVYTSYWNTDSNDRAVMIDAMRDDGVFEFIRNNKEEILEILNEEDDDGLCEADNEADSEG